MRLQDLRRLMRHNGVRQLYAKPLARNDNSKQQIYLGGGFLAVSLIPAGDFSTATSRSGREIIKAGVNLFWLQEDGDLSLAPGTQLILYPQYPEVRLSGFLSRASSAPSEALQSRAEGRILFLGVTKDRRVIAYVAGSETAVAQDFASEGTADRIGVFIPLPVDETRLDQTRERLVAELARVHQAGWIGSKSLTVTGLVPCDAPQCVGYTLEAELGIPRNGTAGPDYGDWEIKAGVVSDVSRPLAAAKPITLMTPEPTGGFYREAGPTEFVRRFGYADRSGREDRLNFGGRFLFGKRLDGVGLTLQLLGYDVAESRISEASGSLALCTDDGEVAASWSYTSLARLWSKKHANTVYVPAECDTSSSRRYRYGSIVQMCSGADFSRVLAAVSRGAVYYDPGIKVEQASSGRPLTKRRSQFRVRRDAVGSLYSRNAFIDVLTGAPIS